MNHPNTTTTPAHELPSRADEIDHQILGIKELIISPYWQYLSPTQRRQWLEQIDELHMQGE